jgi:short-subunit dehydrogenase
MIVMAGYAQVTVSAVGLAPELAMAVYGGSKAFVLHLSQALAGELGPKGVYVQALLPAATRTNIWAKAGKDVKQLAGVMEVDELVDAALVGFDRREAVTIPPLLQDELWRAFEAVRHAMLPQMRKKHAALRYQAVA